MKFLVAVPDHQYYIWQVLVQINNFRKMGIEQDTVYVFGIFNGKPSDLLMSLVNSKNIKARFYLIHDTRDKKGYSSSLRPYILSQFYSIYGFRERTICYLDPDVVFTKPLDFSQFEKDDTWYVSDTISYIGSEYIKSKSPELFKRMCEIVGVNPTIIDSHNQNSGGAQYIMKGVGAGFWNKVYHDCEALYLLMVSTSKDYCPEHPIQAWCADMWAVLWNGWYLDNEIKIHPDLAFCWASDTTNRWDETYIFHNAGVVVNDGNHFSKMHYQISPFHKEVLGKEDSCSYGYIKEIKETEINFPELIY